MAICMHGVSWYISGGVKVNLRDGGVVQMNHAFIICDSIDICKRACGELSQQLQNECKRYGKDTRCSVDTYTSLPCWAHIPTRGCAQTWK